MKVLEEKAAPTVAEKALIASYATIGLPTTKGAEAYICMTAFVKANKDAKDQTWTETATGIKYNAYCAGAVALKTVTALTVMMGITAY